MTNSPASRREAFRLRCMSLALAFALLTAACGGSSDSAGSDSPNSTEVADSPATTTPADSSTEDPSPATTDAGSDDDSSPDSTASDEPVELTASYQGVTESEIHVGISMIDFDNLVELNLAPQGWGDQILVFQSFIDELNGRGGINGRTVVPHFEHYSVLGTTEAEATCVALTGDIETFAVLGGFVGPAETANGCIVDINETILVGGRQTQERLDQAKAPWIDTPALRERRLGIFLELLEQEGMLEDRQVAVIGSIEQEDVYDTASAALEERGLSPVLEAINDAPQGETDAASARWQVLAENIKASGADTVLVIGSSQAAVRGASVNGLDVELWVLEDTGLQNLGAATTPADAHGAVTITSLSAQATWDHPSLAPCRDTFFAANPDVEVVEPDDQVDGDEQWDRAISLHCRTLQLFELIATAAGPNLTQESFAAAAEGLGEFSLPGFPFVSLGPGKPDASDSFLLARFDQDQGENGGLVPFSELLDGTP
ncbi:MAG: hypothetical protein V3V01_17330 [Acidimicrobiales bacterium]